MIRLKYGNTNSFYVPGINGGLLTDTDYAGTLPAFFKTLKTSQLELDDISYILPTRCHPDQIGLAGELQILCVKMLLIDCQLGGVHFADEIFRREKHLQYVPIDEKQDLFAVNWNRWRNHQHAEPLRRQCQRHIGLRRLFCRRSGGI